MAISIEQYRQSIGLHANVKFVMSNNRLLVSSCSIALVVAIVLFLLLLSCGDIAQNPGPITRTKFLSVSHTNIRGLVNKMSSIIRRDRGLVNKMSSIIRRDRATLGGGVAVYVKSNIPFKRRWDLEMDSLELIWLEYDVTRKATDWHGL